jgi:hypothetical protein
VQRNATMGNNPSIPLHPARRTLHDTYVPT